MAVRPYNQDEQEEPYAEAGGGSDSTATDPNAPIQDAPTVKAPETPKPYVPPQTATPQPTEPQSEAPPVRTFAQMEAEGQARPPAPEAPMPETQPAPMVGGVPESGPGVTNLLTGGGQATDTEGGYTPDQPLVTPNTDQLQGLQAAAKSGSKIPVTAISGTRSDPNLGLWDEATGTYRDPMGGLPPTATDTEGGLPSAGIIDPSISKAWGEGEGGAPPPDPSRVGGSQMMGGGGPTPTLPSSVDSILPLLTGKATGNDKSALQQATEAKTLAQLNGSSPYDSAEVKNEYDWLSGNIDDQYATDVRNTDDQFAQRGLYGSAGKDFHSGRLSDLNVGKRSAKETLGRDLANKYATTKGQYDANAIAQGQAGTNAENAGQLDWLHSLMGYGNDAYNHDLETAKFQEGQNESEQDYILRLLQAGYGA